MKNIIKSPETISETIYQYIKNEILTGGLRSRQRILEKDIAKLFDVSQTPAREAIRRLSGEKYLIINARKEIIVAGASWKELQELYEVVSFLDYPAVIKAMDNVSPSGLTQVKRNTQNLEKFLDIEKSDSYLDLTLDIHNEIWSRCGNKFLFQTLSQLMEKIKFFCRQGLSPYPEIASMQRSYEDHRNLVLAIENKDATQIKEIVARHWTMPY